MGRGKKGNKLGEMTRREVGGEAVEQGVKRGQVGGESGRERNRKLGGPSRPMKENGI